MFRLAFLAISPLIGCLLLLASTIFEQSISATASTMEQLKSLTFLSLLANQKQNVFYVTSNSTVSSLAFASDTDSLSFSVSGPSGTMGYSQICISKVLLPDVTKLQVILDSSTISYSSYSNGNTWLITLIYHHSSHKLSWL